MRIVLISLGVCVAGISAFLLLLLIVVQVSCSHPSDNTLAARFHSQEPEFDQMVAMAHADKDVVRIAPDFTRLRSDWNWPRADTGLSQSRWDDYRRLFSSTGVERGISTYDDGSVWFMASAEGIVNRGSSKGYVYSLSALAPIVSNLESDTPPKWAIDERGHYVVYKQLKDRWYLYYEVR